MTAEASQFKIQAMYSPMDLSSILGISSKKVYILLKSGEIKAAKIGRTWRIREVDIIEYLNRCGFSQGGS
jgi:excisionase family DNA binding protein